MKFICIEAARTSSFQNNCKIEIGKFHLASNQDCNKSGQKPQDVKERILFKPELNM